MLSPNRNLAFSTLRICTTNSLGTFSFTTVTTNNIIILNHSYFIVITILETHCISKKYILFTLIETHYVLLGLKIILHLVKSQY